MRSGRSKGYVTRRRSSACQRQARTTLADASRLCIRLPERVPSWCLLHELAHAMTTAHDDVSDGHGPIFMGIYVRLLERYMRIGRATLLGSLAKAGIAIDAHATPMFVDGAAAASWRA
jgi:hypothetical protein